MGIHPPLAKVVIQVCLVGQRFGQMMRKQHYMLIMKGHGIPTLLMGITSSSSRGKKANHTIHRTRLDLNKKLEPPCMTSTETKLLMMNRFLTMVPSITGMKIHRLIMVVVNILLHGNIMTQSQTQVSPPWMSRQGLLCEMVICYS